MARTSPPVHTPPIHTVTLPHYQVRSAPDHLAIGEVLDRAICRLVHEAAGPAERRVAIRAVSLIDHPGMSHDDLTATIVATGTDRYDPARVGPLDHVYGPYGVELHAIPCTVSPAGLRSVHSSGPSVMAEVVSDFYLGPPVDRGGVPLRVDVVTVYDLRMLEGLVIPFHGDEPEPTAYRFRRPASDRPHPRNWRAQAVLSVLQVR